MGSTSRSDSGSVWEQEGKTSRPSVQDSVPLDMATRLLAQAVADDRHLVPHVRGLLHPHRPETSTTGLLLSSGALACLMQLCSACSHSSHTGPVITSCPCRPLQALTPVPHHPPGTRTTSHHRTFATKPAQPVTAASALLAACDLMLPAVPCTPSLASRGRSQPLPRALPICAHAFPTATHAYPHPRPTRRSLLLGLAFPRILIALTGSISTVAQASVSPSASTSASAPASASASSASASALAPAPAPVGWDGMGWDGMGGRKCRLLCIAVLVFVLVVVYGPLLILVQASLGWCTPFLGCLHGNGLARRSGTW